MTEQKQITHKDYVIDVVVEENVPTVAPGATKAGMGGLLHGTGHTVSVSLQESVGVLGQIASAFTASLASHDPKPAAVEINFGLEASGEAGNFIISKVAGKANFSVKMSWKFDENETSH